jgi:LPXTG-motif cell wall-anchored protein
MVNVKQAPEHPLLRTLETVQRSDLKKNKDGNLPGTFIRRFGIFLACLVAVGFFVLPACAYTTPEGIQESGKVYVSGVTMDPSTLFSEDKCTITYFVTNGNANQSVAINHITFGESKDIHLISDTYDTNTNIGPLQTQSYVFFITTESSDGSYFPTFSLSFRDADSLYYRTQVKVDNTPLILAVTDKPDTFTQDKKDTLTLQIANPRQNDVKNVVLKVSGDGILATPSEKFTGTLAAGAVTNVTVEVTPGKETTLDLTVTYDNGDNHHSVSENLPITFGTDKKKATPQMSNVKVKLENGVYDVTGDITNAGLTTANGVSVVAQSPAVPKDPYQSYVVGALKPDDFGSFEVTFTANGVSSIPLQISYKDSDGNVINSRQDVSLTVTDSSAQNQGLSGSGSILPIIAIILLIAVGGGYLYYRRKKNQ